MVKQSVKRFVPTFLAIALFAALAVTVGAPCASAAEGSGAVSAASPAIAASPSAIAASPSVALAPQASKAAKNKAAHKVYKKQVKKLARKSRDGLGAYYQYADIDGDGVHELIAENHPSAGSGRVFYVYTYKDAKLKRLMKTGVYGAQQLRLYKKGRTLVLHSGGHGGEVYDCYVKKNGTYKLVASKGRGSAKFGGTTTPWSYHSANGSALSKSKFTAKTRPLVSGKVKKVKITYYENLVTG